MLISVEGMPRDMSEYQNAASARIWASVVGGVCCKRLVAALRADELLLGAGGDLGLNTLGIGIQALAHDPGFIALVWLTGIAKADRRAVRADAGSPVGVVAATGWKLALAWAGGIGLALYGGVHLVVEGLARQWRSPRRRARWLTEGHSLACLALGSLVASSAVSSSCSPPGNTSARCEGQQNTNASAHPHDVVKAGVHPRERTSEADGLRGGAGRLDHDGGAVRPRAQAVVQRGQAEHRVDQRIGQRQAQPDNRRLVNRVGRAGVGRARGCSPGCAAGPASQPP